MQQRDDNAAAGRAQRVPQRYCATVDIDLLSIESHELDVGQPHYSEASLSSINSIWSIRKPARSKRHWHCLGRGGREPFGGRALHRHWPKCGPTAECLLLERFPSAINTKAEAPSLRVLALAAVTVPVFFKYGAQLWDFVNFDIAELFVLRDHHRVPLALGHGHGRDFIGKSPCIPSCSRAR